MKTPTRRYVMTARAAKAAATRQRILDAAALLYRTRPIEDFTLEEVARQAGSTVQTVLRGFGSKGDLLRAVLEGMVAAGVPLRPTPPGDVAAAVGAIFDIYETLGELVLRRLADAARHPALRADVKAGRAAHRDWVGRAFAPQLAQLSGAARARLFHGLVAATDVYVWTVLRRDEGLDRAAAEAVVRDLVFGITRMTQREEGDGADPVAELVGRRQPAA